MSKLSRIVGAGLVSACLIAPSASSALTVRLDDSNTIGIDFEASDASLVSYSGWVGSFNISTFSAETFDFATSSELSSIAFTISGGAVDSTLTIYVSDDGYVGGADGGTSSVSYLLNGAKLAPGATVTAEAYVDNSDALFGTATQIGSTVFATNNTAQSIFGWSSQQSGAVFLSDPFSMTQIYTLTASALGSTQFDATLTAAVPLPAGGLLLLSALGGLGLARRRRSDLPALA